MSKRAYGFGVGIPTDLDVAVLVKAFGVPELNQVISYEELEVVLKTPRDSNRFKTVVTAWRSKLEREHNVLCKGIATEGLRVLDGAGRVDAVGRALHRALKAITKSGQRAAATSRAGLSPDAVRVLDFVVNVSGQARVMASLEARKLRGLPDPHEGKE